ncbi:MAG TPA: hypothetical protein VE129_18430 [Thermoanaerobaculia bacterium]|nr:hypothetical protein [Thermoanaerobaculia bacterium]
MAAETGKDDHPGLGGNVKQKVGRVRHNGTPDLAIEDGKGEGLALEPLDDSVHVEKEP